LGAKKDSPPLRILIVEDNTDLAENIADYLKEQGHMLDIASDGIGGLHLAVTKEYDAIILDVMLPGMDGLSFCRKLRAEAEVQTPVLMLTARDKLPDKLEGFGAGADDYLVKPFALQELTARLQALVRRGDLISKSRLRVGDLEVDCGKIKVERAGHPIMLNRVCFKILVMLMRAHPNVVSHQELKNALWGDMPPDSDAMRSHIYALRCAIDKPFKHPLLETIHGVGYRLAETDAISP